MPALLGVVAYQRGAAARGKAPKTVRRRLIRTRFPQRPRRRVIRHSPGLRPGVGLHSARCRSAQRDPRAHDLHCTSPIPQRQRQRRCIIQPRVDRASGLPWVIVPQTHSQRCKRCTISPLRPSQFLPHTVTCAVGVVSNGQLPAKGELHRQQQGTHTTCQASASNAKTGGVHGGSVAASPQLEWKWTPHR